MLTKPWRSWRVEELKIWGDRRPEVGSDMSIFVGDLAIDVTGALLHDTFASRYPSVKGAKVVIDPNTGRSKGYGFVRFGDENEKSRAMTEMNGEYCSSRPMRISAATPKKPSLQQQFSSQGGYAPNGSVPLGQSNNDSSNTTVFVGGLDSDVTDEDLRESFIPFGEVVSIKIPPGKGCGFVQFANRSNAEDAIQGLNGSVIGKQTVRLSWARNQGNKQAVNSRTLDYSHFVSLPLAIHPGLVDKLANFQNTILGISASDKDKNLDRDTGGDASDEEEEENHSIIASKVSVELKAEKADPNFKVNVHAQNLTEAPLVAVELKAKDADTPVKENITNIPLVSYRPKESKATASGSSSSNLIELGIEKSIFIEPETFHLTVLMLKLWNKDRVKKAAEVLQSVSPKVIDALENRPVSIRLKGLDLMKGSLAKARVLYAPVEEISGEGRLLRTCQVIIDAFIEAGLVMEKDVQQKLKLHATLMNARYRERKTETRMLDSFDARGIFDQYGSEEWGEYPIREAHLSQRFAFDESGYYHCCASIPFPDTMEVD